MSARLKFSLLLMSALLLGTGCSSSQKMRPISVGSSVKNETDKNTSFNDKQNPDILNTDLTKEGSKKILHWCAEENRPQTISRKKIWVSSENFSGMRHGPSIQHVCDEDKELFYLQMEWNATKKIHTGKLFAVFSSSTKIILSTTADPNFTLLESDTTHPDHIRFSIEGKTHTFDPTHNQFVN